jgi:peroxiredoxin Q/BCP
MESLKEGMKVPFFSVKDTLGNDFSNDNLMGKISVLFFYPKDMTPGCTKEACGFQDQLNDFEEKNVQIIGISPDSQSSHLKFSSKYELTYTLLSDTDLELCKKFGVYREKFNFGIKALGVERSTFIVDRDGTVLWTERKVKVEGHVERVLSFINSLSK